MAGEREPEASRALNSSLGLAPSFPWSRISFCITCTARDLLSYSVISHLLHIWIFQHTLGCSTRVLFVCNEQEELLLLMLTAACTRLLPSNSEETAC